VHCGQLPVGTYPLTVTVPGSKTYIRQNPGVQPAQTIRPGRGTGSGNRARRKKSQRVRHDQHHRRNARRAAARNGSHPFAVLKVG
jgi:hypothetical protein